MSAPLAISVKNALKAYQSKVVLDDLFLNVERGTIYGLLGASGCGKTTLLNCIVGRKSLDGGEIKIFGEKPGEKGSGIPGPQLGYMPQELALIEEFTIRDTLFYFGTIFKMKAQEIEAQLEHLTKLFHLPDANKFLKHCSGGEKRRVSFATALLHSPELLILDEPTVGVDPLLREKLWNYLKGIVAKKQITVLITTHYIEETKEADRIGLMRSGRLLQEDSPQNLLNTYQKESLEEVFLILSERQEQQLSNKNDATSSMNSVDTGYGSRDALTQERKSNKDKTAYMSAFDMDGSRMKALLNKNWKQFYRNIGGLLFLLTFPVIQMWLFENSVGTDPRNLKLGIVNNEDMTTLCTNFDWNGTAISTNDVCHFRNLTCRFLTYLEHPMIDKVLYGSLEDGLANVKKGKVLGVLYVPSNFTESYEERMRAGRFADQWLFDHGEIRAYMDMSNRATGAILATKLLDLFLEFQERLFVDCDMPAKLARIPLQKNFIHGSDKQEFIVFVTPGMALVLVFLLGSTMTSQIIVKEKSDGVWERSIVAGVSSLEITLSHLGLQFIIMLLECVEVMFMMYFVPNLEFVGSLGTMFLLIYLQGICGMAFGFFVSSIARTAGEANILCTGEFLLMVIISGLIWPVEGMPMILRWISLSTPCTMAILSFRDVMVKGWSWLQPEVYSGIGISLAWLIMFSSASVLFVKIKR